MTHRFTPEPVRSWRPARAALAVATAFTIAGLYGCAPKITQVDASYTLPEGRTSPNASLIVWRDQPTFGYTFIDNPPVDPDTSDALESVDRFERYSPTTIHGLIIDGTQADAFEMFRREAGGGVRKFSDFMVPRVRGWLQSETEAYHFVDPAPSSYTPSTYVCRGVVQGVVNHTSPLTNLAIASLPAPANLNMRAVWWKKNTDPSRGPVFVFDKIKVKWDLVPGANRYLIQVYDFRSDLHSEGERILSGTLAPIYDGYATERFVGIAPANVNLLFVGDSTRTDIRTFQLWPLVSGQPYLVRVAAIDAAGHLLAVSLGDIAHPLKAFTDGFMGIQRGGELGPGKYRLYPYGAMAAQDTIRPAGGGGGGGGGG